MNAITAYNATRRRNKPRAARLVNRLAGAVLESLEPRELLTTYYVSASAGNDANDGTSAAPFKSIQRVVTRLAAGDTVVVRAGTYPDGLNIGWDGPVNGTAAAPITFTADPAAPAGSVLITGRSSKTPDAINIENSDHIVIKGFKITNATGTITRAAVRIAVSDFVSVLDNTVDDVLGFGIFSSHTTGLRVEGNTVSRIRISGSSSPTGHGVYVSNSAVDPVVRDNVIRDNEGLGLHLNGDASQGGAGVVSGALIEGNVIRDNVFNGINADGLQNSRIQNNLIVGNDGTGIVLYRIDASGGGTNNVIVNNTVYGNGGPALRLKDGSTGNTVYNNVLLSATGGALRIAADSRAGLYSDYNAVADRYVDDANGAGQTLAQWRTSTGQDAHSFVATAAQLFVDAAAGDHHLKAGGPAVDAGTARPAPKQPPSVDLDGNPRPNAGLFDVGAYEGNNVDVTAPTITGRAPASGATGVPASTVITATFNEPIQQATVSFILRDGFGNVVPTNAVSYDATTRTATLTPASNLNPTTVYTATVSGTKDLAGNTMTSSSWSFTTAAPDSTAPTITGRSPAANATGLSRTINVTVTFSESMQPATLALTLRDAAGNAVAAAVAYDDATRTATLTPSSLLGYGVTYTATVSGAKDLAGNPIAAPSSWSFSTAPLGAGPFNMFGSVVPGTVNDDDTGSSEVGVKFRADVAGTITGIRFYKGPLNTGTHIGHLWTRTGTLLASVTFTGETASGWQTATFSTPVAIAADTTYVASYLAPNGQYAEDEGFFDTATHHAGPLHALASGVDGVNGVYTYTAAPGDFPTDTWFNANYWVDVVFSPSSGGTPDTTAPVISSVASSNLTSMGATVTWTTNEAADTQVQYGTTTAYGSTTTLNAAMVTNHSAALSGLAPSTTYHYRVLSRDAAGNLATSGDFTLTTAAPPDTTGPVISAVTTSNLTSTGVTVAWNTNEASDTQVQYGLTTAYGTSTTLNTSMVTGHSAALAGLSPSTTYHYRVRSRDAAGNLTNSGDFTFTTPAAPDTTAPVISAVANSGLTSTGATVTWTTNEASNTQVQYGTTTAYGSNTTLNASMVTGHSAALSGLAPSTTYHYRVLSRDAAGNLATSTDFTFTTPATPDTTAPVISAVASSGLTSTGVTVTWTTNEASNTQVQYGTSTAYGSSTTLNASMVTSHSAAIAGLAPSTIYHYRVLSRDAAGNLATSTDFTFTTPATPDTTAPVISAVASSNVSSSGATITWTTNEAADTQVQYGTTTAYGSATVLDATKLTGHSAGLSGLAPSTTYHYRVLSRDAAGNLRTSGDFTFTTAAPPDTAGPVISAVASSNVTTIGATIAWTTNEASNTQVEFGLTTAYGETTTLNASMVTGHSASLSGLQPGSTYHYRVHSRDAAGNLATSADFTFTTATPPDTTAPVISAIASSNLTDTGATITWTTDEGSDTQVQYGLTTSYGSMTALDADIVTSHATALSGLAPSTTYHYRVLNRDAAGNLATSADSTFTTPAAPDTTVPTALLNIANLTTAGVAPHMFTITFSDDVAVDASTIDSLDVQVTGPNGFDQFATLFGIDSASDGPVRVATYVVLAPDGDWDVTDNGVYTVTVNADQVADASGNVVVTGTLGDFLVLIDDSEPVDGPTATATTTDVMSATGAYTFTVRYTGAAEIDAETFSDGNVVVSGPKGYSALATFVSADDGADPTTRIVTYSVTPPAGKWRVLDAGTYSIASAAADAGCVTDIDGRAVAASVIGAFKVGLPNAVLSKGTLIVTGTTARDAIGLSGSGSTMTVSINGWKRNFKTFSVKRIQVAGLDGNDVITLGKGVIGSAVNGGAGNDKIIGGVKNDNLNGADGNDTVFGGAGNDIVRGGNGNDTINGSDGNDRLDGGLGADVMVGGRGTDTGDYSTRTTGVKINVDNVAGDGAAGERDNVRTDVENVLGGKGNDWIKGNVGDNTLSGGAGNDTLLGGGGDEDVLIA